MTVSRRKVALIVGGTGQVGKYIARGFVESGCQVVVVSRGKTVRGECAEMDSQVHLINADATADQEVERYFADVHDKFGSADFIVYAAGLPPDIDVPLHSYTVGAWEETFRVYVTGLFLCFREMLKNAAPGAHLFVLSSAITRFPGNALPSFNAGHYASAKAAVNEFCKWARRELHEKGCQLSRIAPAALDVPYHRNAPPYRKPARLIPVDIVVSKITDAALTSVELDEDIL